MFDLGDFVEVPDGRVGTVVYNGLDGVGIKWGRLELTVEDRKIILGMNPLFEKATEGYDWSPDAMLRKKSLEKFLGLECVGKEKLCNKVK